MFSFKSGLLTVVEEYIVHIPRFLHTAAERNTH